jgi:hypothetical protein
MWAGRNSDVTDRQINAGSVSPQIGQVSNMEGKLCIFFFYENKQQDGTLCSIT